MDHIIAHTTHNEMGSYFGHGMAYIEFGIVFRILYTKLHTRLFGVRFHTFRPRSIVSEFLAANVRYLQALSIPTQNYSVKLHAQRYDDNPLLSHPTLSPYHPISE